MFKTFIEMPLMVKLAIVFLTGFVVALFVLAPGLAMILLTMVLFAGSVVCLLDYFVNRKFNRK